MGNIVLAGNPNCGKTSIFNILTGLNQKVSNLAGTTVEISKGQLRLNDTLHPVIDLPGTYSIYPDSEEERIAIEYLFDNKSNTDLIVFVADANQLFRNTLFFSQLSTLSIPMLLLVNMWDSVEGEKKEEELVYISKKLGIPVHPFSAKQPKKYASLPTLIKEALATKAKTSYFEDHELNSVQELVKQADEPNNVKRSNHTLFLYQKISTLFSKSTSENSLENAKTYKMDRVLMHKFWGFIIFGLVMLLMFLLLFPIAEIPQAGVEYLFNLLSDFCKANLPANGLTDLIINGVIPGLGGVLIFVPQIAILFLFLNLLEDTGYVSRISFLLDSSLKKVGLNGKSIIPMVGGFACAIPAIMSARTIGNAKERLITMFITPLMACSARLGVYVILVSLLFIDAGSSSAINKGLLFFAIYMAGIVMALLFSAVLSKFIKQEGNDFMVLEMPNYRVPILRNALQNTWQKTLQFIKGAGKIIFIISIVLWFLASFGPPSKMDKLERQFAKTEKTSANAQAYKTAKLENSYAGHLGKFIEPAIKPLGYDWKIGIALISSFWAREVFVGTISILYAIESDQNEKIVKGLQKATKPNGQPVYTAATIISLLMFYAFALQCMSTLAIMRKETGTWKWPLLQFVYMGGLAYLSALIAYQTLS